MRIDGKECKVRRIFIKTVDSGEYKYVGWMLNEDVNNCTICTKSMGKFRQLICENNNSFIYLYTHINNQ